MGSRRRPLKVRLLEVWKVAARLPGKQAGGQETREGLAALVRGSGADPLSPWELAGILWGQFSTHTEKKTLDTMSYRGSVLVPRVSHK